MYGKEARIQILFCLLAVFSTLAVGTIIEFEKCEDKTYSGDLEQVDITPCPNKDRCVFKIGSTVNGTATFTTRKETEITGGNLEIYAYVYGVKVPFPFEHKKFCEGHGVECPLKPGQKYEGKISLIIKEIFPPTKLVVEVGAIDQNKKYVFCFRFKAKTVR